MRSPEEVKRDFVRQWLKKAEEDINAAKTLLFHEMSFLFTIGFHSQQSAEKYRKAYLTCFLSPDVLKKNLQPEDLFGGGGDFDLFADAGADYPDNFFSTYQQGNAVSLAAGDFIVNKKLF